MQKPPYHRVFIKQGDKFYLVCRLFQQKSDESLMLAVEPSKTLGGSRAGRTKIEGDTIEIRYADLELSGPTEHTSLHASGASHTKLKDGTKRINYSELNPATPLKNLKSAKHLGTLVTREMTPADEVEPTRATDVVIERQVTQKSTILDLIAVPANANIKFNFEWEMNNERQVQLNVGHVMIPFNGFSLLIWARSSDQFDKLPAGSLHIADMNQFVPVVLSMDDEKTVVKLTQLTFDEVIEVQGADDPYKDFTVITATPKYL